MKNVTLRIIATLFRIKPTIPKELEDFPIIKRKIQDTYDFPEDSFKVIKEWDEWGYHYVIYTTRMWERMHEMITKAQEAFNNPTISSQL